MQLIATFIIIFLLVAFKEVGDNYYKTFPLIKKEELQESLLKCLIAEHLDAEKRITYEGVTTFKLLKFGLTLYLNYRTKDPNAVLIKLVGVKKNNYSEATKITEIIDHLFNNQDV
jgi:hypothetical protein